MRQSRATHGAFPALLLAVSVAGGMIACGGSITPNPLTPTTFTINTLPSVDEMLSEKAVGPASAPNTIIEYLSFSNADSGTFHLQVFPQLKSQYADAGRAQIQFRNLIAGGESGVAILLSRCVGNARFFEAVDTLFRNQASWASAADPDAAVERLMLGFGMSPTVENACVANTALQNGLNQVITNALNATYQLPDGSQRGPGSGTFSIQRVPAIVVNNVLLDGSTSDNSPTLANIQKFLQ